MCGGTTVSRDFVFFCRQAWAQNMHNAEASEERYVRAAMYRANVQPHVALIPPEPHFTLQMKKSVFSG